MPSPFPGMDPYLETPHLWPDVHHELISGIRHALNPHLRPNYVARVELRVYRTNEDDPGLEVIIPDARIEKTGVRRRKSTKPNSNGCSDRQRPSATPSCRAAVCRWATTTSSKRSSAASLT